MIKKHSDLFIGSLTIGGFSDRLRHWEGDSVLTTDRHQLKSCSDMLKLQGVPTVRNGGSESGLLKVQQQQLTSRDILVILLDENSFQTGSYHINRVSESEHKLLFSWQAFFSLAFHQASTALCSTHLWKRQPLHLHLLSIQHQLLYLLPPKQNGSHWLHCVIEPECEPVVSMVEEPCCIKIGDLKEVI